VEDEEEYDMMGMMERTREGNRWERNVHTGKTGWARNDDALRKTIILRKRG
jgi:hypothetical protein